MAGLYKIRFDFIADNILDMYLQGTIQRRKNIFLLLKKNLKMDFISGQRLRLLKKLDIHMLRYASRVIKVKISSTREKDSSNKMLASRW